ncbi:sperm-associated antigen 16 protein [Triplophysa rosa]|uniref:Sperm-associated antigen 16 protein n=1 Tax=Triplophysa rosa TaxID=992332 RepID=A0A9W7TFT1_TRIRA|nr:sperm-associated antigen 16 protein [Triplophysa rosa]KAI7796415.1 putative sperm-associated antigen 16 protein [Triplophysa rosa]
MAAKYDVDEYYLEQVLIPDDSDEEYKYEEVTVEDELSVTQGEEDLETAVKAFRDRLDATECATQRVASAKLPVSRIPEVVDDFLRNYLVKMGLERTLDCFQTEWFEMLQKGLLKTDHTELVPDAYTHNQLLDNELKNVQRERDGYKQVAFVAGETIVKLQRERDFHRMQHKRVLQEKNRLIEDLRKLKKHHASYEPALRQLNEKYQTALKQKMLVSLERDRAVSQVQNIDSSLRISHSSPGTQTMTTVGEKIQKKIPPCDIAKHPKDSEFPASTRVNPYLPQIKTLSSLNTKSSNFSLSKSFKAHTMAVSFLALHPRKMIVASSSDDQLWRLWGIPNGEMVMTAEGHTDWLSSCSFHPSGGLLGTTSGDTTVKIWDFAQGRCVLSLEGHIHATWGCSFHSGGDFVASCSMDNTAKVWDLNSERCRCTLRGHVDSVNSIYFLPYSNILLTCSADKTLSLWDARAGLCAQTFYGHKHSCNHATFNGMGDTIASCDSFGVVKLWDVRNVSAMVTMDTGPHPSNQVAFSPTGRMLAVASNDGFVKMVEIASLHVSSLKGHEDAVQSVIFDHKGEYLLSAGSDGAILVWAQQ